MHFVTFIEAGKERFGVFDSERNEIIDIAKGSTKFPTTLLEFIAAGPDALREAQKVARASNARISFSAVKLIAPIPKPARNIFCVGKNYRDHLKEVQSLGGDPNAKTISEPEVPIIFTKATTTVTGPGDVIPASHDPTESVDYEGELTVVIGTGGRSIKRADAMNHIFGYTIANDVSSRRLQKAHQQWFLGKSIDGFCPCGPAIVTRDAIPDVNHLRIQTWVNGELRQDCKVGEMIYDIPSIIETISKYITLQPGDMIITGTPAGVGMGLKPPRYLRPGDRVSITVDPIGTLENPVG